MRNSKILKRHRQTEKVLPHGQEEIAILAEEESTGLEEGLQGYGDRFDAAAFSVRFQSVHVTLRVRTLK